MKSRREKVGRRLVESPVGESDARVDPLQLPLQVQQERPVPGGKPALPCASGSPALVCTLRKSAKRPMPPVVQRRESRQQAVALGGREGIGVLTDPHHQRRGADRLVVRRVDDLARWRRGRRCSAAGTASEEKLNRGACKRQGQLKIIPRGARNVEKNTTCPPPGGAQIPQPHRHRTDRHRSGPTAGPAPAPAPSRHSRRPRSRRR